LGSIALSPAILFEIFVGHSAISKYFYKLLRQPEIFVPGGWIKMGRAKNNWEQNIVNRWLEGGV